MKKLRASILLGALILLLGSGCRAAPPRIEATSWDLFRLRDPESGLVGEVLSVFVKAEDDDGREDMEEIYLLHPATRLYWRLTGDQWEERERKDGRWIGSAGFAAPGGIPRGEYRLVLIDRAGEQAEERVYLDLKPGNEEANFILPELRRDGESLVLASETVPESDSQAELLLRLLIIDDAGRVVLARETLPGRVPLAELAPARFEAGFSWYILRFNDEAGWYEGSGPYRF